MSKYTYDIIDTTVRENFRNKYTIQPNGCWIWHGCIQTNYSRVNIKGRVLVGHRVSWMIANKQDWPADKPHARHLCNQTLCVNPAHIVPGTPKENGADLTTEQRDAMRKRTIKRCNKRIQTPHGIYNSRKEAALAIWPTESVFAGIGRIARAMKKPNSGYFYL